MFPLLDTYRLLTECTCCAERRGHCRACAFQLVISFLLLLRTEANAGCAKVTVPQINRDAGYGMEVPCTYMYILYGPLKP